MEDSADSQHFSDDSSSYSDESSDLSNNVLAGHSWSANPPSSTHLPPSIPNRRNLLLPERPPLSSRSDSVSASRADHNHCDRSRINRLPEARSNSPNLPRPREPAQFDLPNFPLPTASRDSQPLSFAGGIDPTPSVLDISGWGDWDNGLISPLSRPASRVSWGSNDSFDLPLHPTLSDFIDLTDTNSPPNMPDLGNKRRPTKSRGATASAADGSNKRRKTGANLKKENIVKNEESEIEEVDLRDVNDDNGLSQVLQRQQEDTIKAQRQEEGKPLKLSSLQCVVCLESFTDVTATHCGG